MKFIIALIFSWGLLAKEVIHNFDTEVVINYDNTITVTEKIEVTSLGHKIKRGIFRDLPLIRKSQSFGVNTNAFKVLSVLRNERAEPYHVKALTNGIRIYIGNKKRYIKKGKHTFEITYKMSRHIYSVGSGESELFWNITGDGWKFPISKSSVKFFLETQNPETLNFFEGYTGKYGSKNKDYTVISESEEVEVRTNNELPKLTGWSIAVRFPSDQIAKLSFLQALKQDMKLQGLQYKVLSLFLTLFVLFALWYVKGLDPKRGTIIPLFSPPSDLSPAQINMAYLHKNHKDAIPAAIINMAVKGAITIEEGTNICIRKTDCENVKEILSKEEYILYTKLLSDDFITLARTNRLILQEAKKAFEKELNTFGNEYFTKNWPYAIIGTLVAVFSIWHFAKDTGDFAVGAIIGFFEYGCIGYLITRLFSSRSTDSKWSSFILIFPITFMLFHGGIFAYGSIGYSKLYIVFFLLHALPYGVFLALIPSATKKGQRLVDKIEGFKHYLSIAEKDRLDKLNPPELTPEIFEKFLPYAHALGEEGSWSNRFENEVSKSLLKETYSRGPTWYSNSNSSFNSSTFASALGSSITSAVASSSSSSSSGSGGGGGGGGGGGW